MEYNKNNKTGSVVAVDCVCDSSVTMIRFLKKKGTDRIGTRVARWQCGLSEGRYKLTLLETTFVQ